MGVYVVPWFRQWMAKQRMSELDLCRAVLVMSRGLVDAALGGDLFKKRISRSGGGKRRGYRTLVATRHAGQWFILHGFTKNDRENVGPVQLRALKAQAAAALLLSTAEVQEALDCGHLLEVFCEKQC